METPDVSVHPAHLLALALILLQRTTKSALAWRSDQINMKTAPRGGKYSLDKQKGKQ